MVCVHHYRPKCCGQGFAPYTTLILTNTSGVEPSRFADSNCSSQRHSPCVAFTIPPPQHCMSIPCCHSVFIRPLPPYLTLPLRQALFCHGKERKPGMFSQLPCGMTSHTGKTSFSSCLRCQILLTLTGSQSRHSRLDFIISFNGTRGRCHGRL